jgi:glycosyltransferase involved in cell wall biosynthesis
MDSVPGVVCPPELYIFNDPGAYAFDALFKERARQRVPVQPRSPYAMPRAFFNEKYFPLTGLNSDLLKKMLDKAGSLSDFVTDLAATQEKFRNRPVHVFCEKTPININEAYSFCQAFPAGLFVHIARDPITALPSLINRGFGLYEATLIWAYQNWVGLRVATFPNYRLIRYEDLLMSPFQMITGLLQDIGIKTDPATIEQGFLVNKYRHGLDTPGTWTTVGKRETIQQANAENLDESDRALLAALTMEIFEVGEASPQLHRIQVPHLLEQLGYKPPGVPRIHANDDAHAHFKTILDNYWANCRNVTQQRHISLTLEGKKLGNKVFVYKHDIESFPILRVLQGVTGQANQPQTIASALSDRGHFAHSCTVADHPFGYSASYYLNLPTKRSLPVLSAVLTNIVHRYDIFHFHARSFSSGYSRLPYPALLDMLWLKSIGKKVFFHFRGSEIRNKALFDRTNPWHFRPDETDPLKLFSDIPANSKLCLRSFVNAVCDGVFVVDEEIRQYVGHNSIIVPRVLEDASFRYIEPFDRLVPVVVHAPSRRGVKGTEYVISAVDRLRARGIACELRVIEGLTHAEAMRQYRDADIVVDQLRLGWYGVLTVEAMALGKPVVCYIRPDLWHAKQDALPLANADPNTVEKVLERLIDDKAERRKLGLLGYDYSQRTHKASEVAKRLENLYQICDRPASEVDWVSATRLLDHQFGELSERIKDREEARLKRLSERHSEQLEELRKVLRKKSLFNVVSLRGFRNKIKKLIRGRLKHFK